MLNKILAVLLLAVACFGAGAFTLGTLATPAAASTHAASSHTSLWWDGTTCHDYASGRFHAFVVASRHADTYLRADSALLVHDLHVGAKLVTIELDRSFVVIDCTQTGDGSPL